MKALIKITALLLVFASVMQAGKGGCRLKFASSVPAPGPISLAFSNHDGCLATANLGNNTVSIFGFDKYNCQISSQPVSTIPFGAMMPLSLAFAPSGNCLAVFSGGPSNGILPPSALSFFSFDESTCTAIPNPLQHVPIFEPLTTLNQPQAIAFSPNGRFFAYANIILSIVEIYAFDSLKCSVVLPWLQHLDFPVPFGVTFSHDSSLLAVVGGGGLGGPGAVGLFQYDAKTDKYVALQTPVPTQGTTPIALAFSPTDFCLAVTNFLNAENNVSFFQVNKQAATLQFLEIIPSGGTFPIGIDYSPNGNCLAVGNTSGTIGLFSFPTQNKCCQPYETCLPCGLCTVIAGPSDCPNTVANLEYSHSGCCLGVANFFTNNVSIFSTQKKKKR